MKSQNNYLKNNLINYLGKKIVDEIPQEEMDNLNDIFSGKIDKDVVLDKFGRILASNSNLLALGLTEKPVVNQLINKYKEKSFWPNGKKWAVALSHDIDITEKYGVTFRRFLLGKNLNSNQKKSYFLRVLVGLVKNQTDKVDYWNFDKIIDMEEKYGFRSTMFFTGTNFWETCNPYDFVYDISEPKFRELFEKLKEKNFEIGMHGSYDSSQSFRKFKKEKDTLEKFSGVKIKGLRMHFWHLNWHNPEETFEFQRKAGFLYDTSLAWNDQPGFVRGVALPFRPYNMESHKEIDFCEIPATMMDSSIMSNGYKKALEVAKKHLSIVKQSDGLAVLDWHNHIFCEKDFPGWGKTYEEILKLLASDSEVWVAPLSEIYEWWRANIYKVDKK